MFVIELFDFLVILGAYTESTEQIEFSESGFLKILSLKNPRYCIKYDAIVFLIEIVQFLYK